MCVCEEENCHVGEKMKILSSPLQRVSEWANQGLGLDRGVPVRDYLRDGLLLEEDTLVPRVLKQVLALEVGLHIMVRFTASNLVGELC